MKMDRIALALALLLLMSLVFSACSFADAEHAIEVLDDIKSEVEDIAEDADSRYEDFTDEDDYADEYDKPDLIDRDLAYSSPDDVALYIHTYGELPRNFLTKKEAEALGWVNSEGNLWEVADGMSIGGDSFGNREGLLPSAPGRTWRECDVSYEGGFRGAERIVFSNDGLIYYTDDHYESFTQLY